MRDQPPLALPPPAGSAHWTGRALPAERTTGEITEASAAFVALALEVYSGRPGMPALGLSAHLMPALGRLGRQGLAALRLPFVLFDLRFRDAAFWRAQVAATSSVLDGEAGRIADARLTRTAIVSSNPNRPGFENRNRFIASSTPPPR